MRFNGRGERIRTSDLTVPNHDADSLSLSESPDRASNCSGLSLASIEFGQLRNLIVDVSLKLFERDLAVLWRASASPSGL